MSSSGEAGMDEKLLRNRTFGELKIGDAASIVRIIGHDDIDLLAALSGDAHPARLDAAFATTNLAGDIVAHGMWSTALIAAVLGTRLPGPGTIYLGQDLKFLKPVMPGDTVTATVSVREKRPETRIVVMDTVCTNQSGDAVLAGTATVVAPEHAVEWARTPRPEVPLRRHDRYEAFVKAAAAQPMLPAAIVHPCSPEAILAAVEVREHGLFEPLLVGPEAKIRAAAEAAQVDLDGIAIEAVPHSHAAAARAVELAVAAKVAVLVKGSLHTDELLGAVVAPGCGLRTERRISHAYAMDVPAYTKPLIVTDAAVNIRPTLEHKRDICQNAIDLMHRLGLEEPRVAVLAAVETVNAQMPATLDAAALTVMSARGQITGARVDGPLAFDNAVSPDAARTKGIVSPVAGQADILLVPDLEAGNMLAKQLIYFAGATAAGLVLGARVPIVLTSRSDSLAARIASAALAKLVAAPRVAPGLPA
jgi:phosphate acetyltransferase